MVNAMDNDHLLHMKLNAFKLLRCHWSNFEFIELKTQCPRGFLLDLSQAGVGTSPWYQFLHLTATASMLFPQEAEDCHALVGTQEPLHLCSV